MKSAYELVAEGTDIATGRRVTLYQVVLPDRPRICAHAGHGGLDARRDDGAGVPESCENVPLNGAMTD